jgi:hypothetical protein
VEAREEQWARGTRQHAGRRIERPSVGIWQGIGTARRRQRDSRPSRDVGGDIKVDWTARLGHRKPGRVGDPMGRSLDGHAETGLAGGHCRGMTLGEYDHGRPIHLGAHNEGERRRGALRRSNERGTRRVDEIAADRGHDARASVPGRQRYRHPSGPSSLAQPRARSFVGRTEESWRARTPEAVDDDVGDGVAAHGAKGATSSRSSRTPDACVRAPGAGSPPSSRTRTGDSPRRERRTPRPTARPRRLRSGAARPPRPTAGRCR